MKPLSIVNEMHASKKLWQSNKSRESLLQEMDKSISKVYPHLLVVYLPVCAVAASCLLLARHCVRRLLQT